MEKHFFLLERGLASIRANEALIILEELLHLLIKLLLLLGCESTTVFSARRRPLATTTFVGGVPHIKFLVPLMLGFIKINCLLKLTGGIVPPFNWTGF